MLNELLLGHRVQISTTILIVTDQIINILLMETVLSIDVGNHINMEYGFCIMVQIFHTTNIKHITVKHIEKHHIMGK